MTILPKDGNVEIVNYNTTTIIMPIPVPMEVFNTVPDSPKLEPLLLVKIVELDTIWTDKFVPLTLLM